MKSAVGWLADTSTVNAVVAKRAPATVVQWRCNCGGSILECDRSGKRPANAASADQSRQSLAASRGALRAGLVPTLRRISPKNARTSSCPRGGVSMLGGHARVCPEMHARVPSEQLSRNAVRVVRVSGRDPSIHLYMSLGISSLRTGASRFCSQIHSPRCTNHPNWSNRRSTATSCPPY
ncbi:unnamed protein product [Toxocara canis]|uniref:Uncharacterized protein n=1 Tax=Toxocara canis TaxID=6265 RepID=A0A183UR00_TOXCA|nr:unnamed protein product [Toxocara canis]